MSADDTRPYGRWRRVETSRAASRLAETPSYVWITKPRPYLPRAAHKADELLRREKGKEEGNYLGEKELREGRGRELKGSGGENSRGGGGD
ncbi:hypothetical protein HaLaN_08391 [Haematococcus lacustris]|uniref:Uncharacterized protein n=1 Tax=Haematococcus lacustris TaxID=44745 RepID=A0A699Z0X4_HAELA|nr:hypothetical protein HaLaN_08391 [Haematococcus lacustris]